MVWLLIATARPPQLLSLIIIKLCDLTDKIQVYLQSKLNTVAKLRQLTWQINCLTQSASVVATVLDSLTVADVLLKFTMLWQEFNWHQRLLLFNSGKIHYNLLFKLTRWANLGYTSTSPRWFFTISLWLTPQKVISPIIILLKWSIRAVILLT